MLQCKPLIRQRRCDDGQEEPDPVPGRHAPAGVPAVLWHGSEAQCRQAVFEQRWPQGFCYPRGNSLLGNIENALHGTYHALRPKCLQRYLSGFCHRLNRRFDLVALGPRWLCAAVHTPPLPCRIATLDA
ncbi:hypothetical protein NRY95_15425 [Xanthomonas campestris pv. phormiicola]|nr:hypothetical protein [Xanthomonas campestris pv. phormiicola]UYC15112.1 hypothetical protein NRY95_15425 [Xanthomonas campestris pv. phormiicola]